ncbi:MAG: acetyl-CoA carboxylase biotin carboxyl carrier protein [Deltaproteobacteria bacterium]|nr:acetyl-CoA carboxylase biotin carboxyl carrier protein [Deltaproteobacteria bacterium]
MALNKKTPPKAADNSGEVPEKVIRKLSDLLKSTDLAEIEISTGKMNIRVRAREAAVAPMIVSAPVSASVPSSSTSVSKPSVEAQSDLHIIRSPFVGTFYRSPSPTHPAFVEANQTISKGQTLCIVEAMKLMNEIEADVSGLIEKVYVENGTPVEFNSPLFGIRK